VLVAANRSAMQAVHARHRALAESDADQAASTVDGDLPRKWRLEDHHRVRTWQVSYNEACGRAIRAWSMNDSVQKARVTLEKLEKARLELDAAGKRPAVDHQAIDELVRLVVLAQAETMRAWKALFDAGKDWEQVAAGLEKAEGSPPQPADILANWAQLRAEAFANLEEVHRRPFANQLKREWAATDPDLASLLDDPRFARFLDRLPTDRPRPWDSEVQALAAVLRAPYGPFVNVESFPAHPLGGAGSDFELLASCETVHTAAFDQWCVPGSPLPPAMGRAVHEVLERERQLVVAALKELVKSPPQDLAWAEKPEELHVEIDRARSQRGSTDLLVVLPATTSSTCALGFQRAGCVTMLADVPRAIILDGLRAAREPRRERR
jgi:hypothetical protein